VTAKDKSTKSAPASTIDPGGFAKMGGRQAENFMDVQKEFQALIEQANRDWLARAEKERALASELATKLTAAKSLPDVAKEYQEWMTRRMELMVEDSQKFFADSQKFMNSTVRLMSKGWPTGGST
jgi:hypothetical protein